MEKFLSGQPVKFKSLMTDHVFRGRIVRRIAGDDYMVEDRSGRPPRPINVIRLEPDVDGAFFAPKVAA
jgi:uncharacterized protein YdeI (BOF family)